MYYSRYFENYSIFLGSILWMTSVSVVASGHCPHYVNDQIQQCVQPVAQYAKVLNQRDNSSTTQNSNNEFGQALQLPKLGGQVFKELCRLIRNFETCVDPHREKCPKHITINLIEASYGFLCNAGYETFMNSAECLMELDQRPSVKHCHDETLRDIEKANGELGITMPAKLDRMCEALNFFSGCVRHPIRHNCGLEAWQVIFRVLKDTTKTLMPACQFTGTSPKVAHTQQQQQQQVKETTPPVKMAGVDPRYLSSNINTNRNVANQAPPARPNVISNSDKERISNRRAKERPTVDQQMETQQQQQVRQELASSSSSSALPTVAMSFTIVALHYFNHF